MTPRVHGCDERFNRLVSARHLWLHPLTGLVTESLLKAFPAFSWNWFKKKNSSIAFNGYNHICLNCLKNALAQKFSSEILHLYLLEADGAGYQPRLWFRDDSEVPFDSEGGQSHFTIVPAGLFLAFLPCLPIAFYLVIMDG